MLFNTYNPIIIMIKFHRQTIFETLGRHPIHPFPARMAPGIALEVLAAHANPIRVLDPMMGSGTVLAVARSRGHRAYGLDLDPLAVLMSKVWTTTVKSDVVLGFAARVQEQAKAGFKSITAASAYPIEASEETRAFVRYWFDDYARRQLTALSAAITRVSDVSVRDVLWCGFSRLIITKQSGASLAMDLSHSRPHRAFKYAPTKPFNKFLDAVKMVVENCPQAGQHSTGPVTFTKQGDARHLPLQDDSIDLVLTSPPYLNGIDYIRCSKFSLVWMGHSIGALRDIRNTSVGTESSSHVARNDHDTFETIRKLKLSPKLDDRNYAILSQYVYDMHQTVKEAARVLIRGGRAVYVVGDSTVRGTYVRNSGIITAVAESAGLKLESRRTRLLPPNRRYLPPPSMSKSNLAIDARLRREVVLRFTKAR